MYLTKRTLSESVNLKIRPAVINFLLMTASTPISSASFRYSIFSTSAITRSTPNFLATTQARILASSLSVTATKASKFLIDSSTRKSEFRPSPLTTVTDSGSRSESSRHRLLSESIIFTLEIWLLSCSATSSPIRLPPRIIVLSTSILSLPRKCINEAIPSRLEMM